ncbi:hypothetical protein [Microvirga terricola]|uniref:MotA/TolQ/ExbB proton channel family protein n=1 Tax=Microvirga terricola TaxID=2719797 RepID=A0ABX0VA92_9HYPH|nr:hypothetical protein [Microvirga terricola]NIX75600.1 hypothetical protein [Microvirga terricola]
MRRALLLGTALVPIFMFAIIAVSTLGFGILIPAIGLGILFTNWPELMMWGVLMTLVAFPLIARRAGRDSMPYVAAGAALGVAFPLIGLGLTTAATGTINLLGDRLEPKLSTFAIMVACLGATGLVAGISMAFVYVMLARLFVFQGWAEN